MVGPTGGSCGASRANAVGTCTGDIISTSSVIRLAGDGGCHLPLEGKALGRPMGG